MGSSASIPGSQACEGVEMENCRFLDESRTVRKICLEGCSCERCTAEMFRQLQRVQPSIRQSGTEILRIVSRVQHDAVEGAIELAADNPEIEAQCPPTDTLKQNAAILKQNWSNLNTKLPNERTLLLSRTLEKKPTVIDPLLEMFSEEITFDSETEKETSIRLNLKLLLNPSDDNVAGFREMRLLKHLADEIEDPKILDRILAHPLVSAFATLKYKQYRPFSITLLIYHILFALLFTLFAFHVFLSGDSTMAASLFAKLISAAVLAMSLPPTIKAFVCFRSSGCSLDLTHVAKIGDVLCTVVIILACFLPSLSSQSTAFSNSVNKDITAFGVMIAWLLVLCYFTKLNLTAAYVQTFFQIVVTYIKFLLVVALCLFIGLTSTHAIIFYGSYPGGSLVESLERSLVRVLTGRMNYEDYTGAKVDYENPFSVFSYFILFFVLATVMMAMIIGLAQNDLKRTRSQSAAKVLCQVIKDISEVEWVMRKFTGLCGFRGVREWLISQISVRGLLEERETILRIQPHSNINQKLPSALRKAIYDHLIKRKVTCSC